jgi:hypothetical protein
MWFGFVGKITSCQSLRRAQTLFLEEPGFALRTIFPSVVNVWVRRPSLCVPIWMVLPLSLA